MAVGECWYIWMGTALISALMDIMWIKIKIVFHVIFHLKQSPYARNHSKVIYKCCVAIIYEHAYILMSQYLIRK